MKKRTQKKKVPKNKTRKTVINKETIIKTFFEILNSIKLYHWKTGSYSQHKATDEIHEALSKQTDRFIEVLMGKTKKKVSLVNTQIKMYDLHDKLQLKHRLFEFRQFLLNLDDVLQGRNDNDLRNIRDEMVESIHQFLYLLTLE